MDSGLEGSERRTGRPTDHYCRRGDSSDLADVMSGRSRKIWLLLSKDKMETTGQRHEWEKWWP